SFQRRLSFSTTNEAIAVTTAAIAATPRNASTSGLDVDLRERFDEGLPRQRALAQNAERAAVIGETGRVDDRGRRAVARDGASVKIHRDGISEHRLSIRDGSRGGFAG